jgi:predicted AlkP superfamily pyrophosphatase or phosphodiesterase
MKTPVSFTTVAPPGSTRSGAPARQTRSPAATAAGSAVYPAGRRRLAGAAGTLRRFLLTSACLLIAWRAVADPPSSPRTTLVWISLDGIRPDYIARAETPFFDRLMQQGAYSLRVKPLFPSLTFASHTTQATGAPAERHGIVGNSFYDNRRDRHYGYPNFPWLLQADPLWTVAARQGVTVAVLGWPLSHRQSGKNKARYFDESFDPKISDTRRLTRLLDLWRAHREGAPLRLLMGYGIGPDTAGHRYGPDARETAVAVEEVDRLMAQFEREMLKIWNARRAPDDLLYLWITSDHGMSPVHTLVNLRRCAGLPSRSPIRLVTGGSVGHVFFNRIEDPREREARRNELVKNLRRFEFMEVYTRENLPERWQFRHPHRTGDIVVTLPRGYTFQGRIRRETRAASEVGEPLGMHGYCPDANPEMLTVAFFQRYPTPLGGQDIGSFAMDRLHVTAARWLGIDPSPQAQTNAIPLPMPGLTED